MRNYEFLKHDSGNLCHNEVYAISLGSPRLLPSHAKNFMNSLKLDMNINYSGSLSTDLTTLMKFKFFQENLLMRGLDFSSDTKFMNSRRGASHEIHDHKGESNS